MNRRQDKILQGVNQQVRKLFNDLINERDELKAKFKAAKGLDDNLDWTDQQTELAKEIMKYVEYETIHERVKQITATEINARHAAYNLAHILLKAGYKKVGFEYINSDFSVVAVELGDLLYNADEDNETGPEFELLKKLIVIHKEILKERNELKELCNSLTGSLKAIIDTLGEKDYTQGLIDWDYVQELVTKAYTQSQK